MATLSVYSCVALSLYNTFVRLSHIKKCSSSLFTFMLVYNLRISLSVLILLDIRLFKVLDVYMMLLWIFLYQSVDAHCYKFDFGIYLVVVLLCHKICIYSVLENSATLFFSLPIYKSLAVNGNSSCSTSLPILIFYFLCLSFLFVFLFSTLSNWNTKHCLYLVYTF